MVEELNDTDRKILGLCYRSPLTISQIAQKLEISSPSVSVRVKDLKEKQLVSVKGGDKKGKKVLVRTTKGIKVNKFMLRILSEMEELGGVVPFEKFATLPMKTSLEEDLEERYDMWTAQLTLPYSGYVKQYYKLTEEGEKFLKENESKKN